MDKVKELEVELKEALENFHQTQEKKRHFLFNSHLNIRHILISNLNESFRESLEGYFDLRNESLQTSLKRLDEALNKASEALDTMATFRAGVVQASNRAIQPPIHAEDSDLLVNGKGVSAMQKISSETEDSVLRINDLQLKYSDLMDEVEEKLPLRVDAVLDEAKGRNQEAQLEGSREAKKVYEECLEEVQKAVQVLRSTDKMREELERLLAILHRPKAPLEEA